MNDRIQIFKGDITRMDVDAIVNAANNALLGGGGVDGAIHREGGPAILEECKAIRHKQGGCKTGQAVITTAGNLMARYVIHTVGPVWRGGKEDESLLLESAYHNSLQLAVEHACQTIAFPNISTGVYGYPKREAALIALRATKSFLSADDTIRKVIFVCYDDENFSIYKSLSDKELHNGPDYF